MKKILLMIVVVIMMGSLFNGFSQQETYLKNRILVEGLYIRNLGNFGEVWSNSTGGYIGYSIAFPEHNLLMMRTGFVSNTLKDGVNYEDASSTILPVEVGGRYYFIDNRLMPFVQFMNGINLIFENTNLEGEKEDKTLVKYAWQIGFGLTVNIISNLSFDITASYQSNFYHTEAMNTGFEYTAGIGFAL
jgi:hypothetical protein